MLRLPRLSSRLSPSFASLQRRNLASSGLLTRAWQNDTIADLRSEAKLRGLSAKGSKLALASRIDEYERNLIQQSNASGSRHASSAQPSTPQTEVPGNPELSPASAAEIFNVKLPDLSQGAPQSQIQIPYLPDYWNSSSPATSSTGTVQEETLPKILVVAGVETHPGGGPSHNLLDFSDVDTTPQKVPEPITTRSTEGKRTDSVFDDMAEDLGLPPVKDIKTSLWKLF